MRQKIIWAYDFAKLIHTLQKRDCGERYFNHCRRVALLILRHCRDPGEMEMAIALMHDVIEDGTIDPNFLVPVFGESITEGVETLSKKIPHYEDENGLFLGKERKSDEEYYAAIATAPRRIRRVKIADRIDNISDMKVWDAEAKKEYITETRKYIIPIARDTDNHLLYLLRKETDKAERNI